MDNASRPTSQDRVRQVTVTVAEVACIIGTLVGVGVIGTRVEESSGGRLAADATLIAPATPAFSIWSVIYLGLAAYTVWQWLPRNATDPRARATGWLAAAWMVLNAAWLLVTQAGWLWVSVAVIFALVIVLARLVDRLGELRQLAGGLADRLILDGTFGLYLGWVVVASCANVAATLVASGVNPPSAVAQGMTVLVLAVAAGIGSWLARRLGARYAVALAMAWGLGWIAVGRSMAEPQSLVVAVAAAAAAAIVLLSTVLQRRRLEASNRPISRSSHGIPKAGVGYGA